MLLYSPRWLFFLPGAFLATAGALLTGALLTGPLTLGRITLDVHSLLASVAALIVGSQLIFLGLFARSYASRARLLPPSPRLDRFVRAFSLELGLAVGLVLFLLGGGLFGYGLVLWGERAFGDIVEYQQTLRVVIAGTAGALLGLEVFFSSFVLSLISTEEPNHTLRVEAD
jgi:hypothetical protein